MPTALSTIDLAKEQAITYQPLLLAKITFRDASVLRLSTHPLNVAEGGAQYAGADWLARINQQEIARVQALGEYGIDLVPSITLRLADPDAYLYTNFEAAAGKGFKGAEIELRLVFCNVASWTFSSDSRVCFTGICEKPSLDTDYLTLTAVAKTSLTRALLPIVPIQRRCPWVNPVTTAQRAESDNPDSVYYECGETRDTTTAPPCSYTKETCTRPDRFGGVTWTPPAGMRVREYTSGQWFDVKGNGNDARYGDYFPMVYGTAWVEPPVLNVVPDGNYVRGECVVCVGEVGGILRVVVNDIELSPANQQDGTAYSAANRDYRYNWISSGKRDGSPNADAPYNSQGDPYGSMAAIMFTVPRSTAGGEGVPRVRVLVRGPKLAQYKRVASVSVTSEVATVTFDGPNADVASNDPAYRITITGSSLAGINGAWAGLTGWTYGPPGTVTFACPGVADGSGTGGVLGYWEHADNAAWVLADLLTWVGYHYDDLDIESFLDTSLVVADRPCALVLRQRRSALETIKGLRQAYGLLLYTEPATGKLRCVVRQTLAAQQPAAITGSNYATAVASKLADGTAANGYVAYRFDAASILRNDKPTSLRELSRFASDAPNRVSFAFQDRTQNYEMSTISVLDSDDIARMGGQEVAGSLSVAPEGLTSYEASMRAARVGLAELHRGNEIGDTRGTRSIELETSFRALHLRIGHIVMVNDTRHGLSNQLFRVRSISPSQNAETYKLALDWHEDDWYTTAWATDGSMGVVERHRDQLERPAFVWRPDHVAPATGDEFFAVSERSFGLGQSYTEAADGSQVASLTVTGKLPVNDISDVAPPTVPLQGTTATTGGTLPGGRVLWVAICSQDGTGYGAPSAPVRVDLPVGTDTCTATVAGLLWPAGATGHAVFAGWHPQRLSYAAGAATTPSSVTLTAINEASWGAPDIEFDRLRIRAKRVHAAGPWLGRITTLVTTTLTVTGAAWTTNQWAGYDLSLLSDGLGDLPIANARIVSNTADALTLEATPDLTTLGAGAGDWFVIRSKPSAADATSVTDPAWDLDTDGCKGKLLRVIAGTQRGLVVPITGNTATVISAAFPATMDTTSRYIIEDPEWAYDRTTDQINNADPAAVIAIDVDVPNRDGSILLVEATAIDGGGAATADPPVRDILVLGAAGVGAVVAPGHVTSLAGGGTSQKTIRGQVWNQIEGTYTAPADAVFRDFDGVELYLYDEGGAEFPQGHFPYTGEPEGEGEYAFEHIAGEGNSNVTWTLVAVARSRFAAADITTAPSIAMEVAQKEAAPKAPTGVTLVIEDVGEKQYRGVESWTKPTPQGGTVEYERRYEFAEDDAGVTIESTVFPGSVYGYATEAAATDVQSKQPEQRWARLSVRGVNAWKAVSAWASSDWMPINADPDEVIAQPESADWTVTAPTNANGGYRADANGNQFARVRIAVVALPAGADYVQLWLDRGDGYELALSEAGLVTVDHWVPQPRVAEDWDLKLTANTFRRTVFPGNDTIHPPKTISIDAWQDAMPLTSGTCAIQEITQITGGGKKRYRMKHEAVGPADPNRQAIRVYRRWTDSSYTPVSGDDGAYKNISGVNATSGTSWTWFSAEIEGFEAPSDGTHYNQIAYVPMNHAGDENWTDALAFNISFAPDGGFNAAAINPLTLGQGANIIDGKLVATKDGGGLSNGNFAAGLNDWDPPESGIVATTTDAFDGQAALIPANSSNRYFSQTVGGVVPGRIYRLQAYARESLNTTGSMYMQWLDSAGAYLSDIPPATITGDSYLQYAVTGTAVANAAKLQVVFFVPASATTGRMLIDNVVLTVEEPTAGALARDAAGIKLNYNTAEYTLVGGNLTVNGVPLEKAVGFTNEFKIDTTLFSLNEVNAARIVAGTIISAVTVAGAIAVGQLTAGTATFTGDVILQVSGGGKLTLSGSVVSLGIGSFYFDVSSLGITTNMTYTGGSIFGSLVSAPYVNVEAGGTGLDCGGPARFRSSTITIDNPSNWRTALGLTTATLNYKDHSGTNQTMTVVVPV